MKKNKQVKHSLTVQFTKTILGLIAGTVLLCWFLNTTFLEGYYTYNKQQAMLEGFTTIDQKSEEGNLDSASFDVGFEQICANGNISILVISADGSIVRASVNDTNALKRQFMDVLFSNDQDRSAEVLKETSKYVLEKQVDSRMNEEYLVLWGTLSDGNLILMRTALESIRESAGISNRFLAYIGIFAIILGTVISIFTSKKIARPILELTDISRRMTNLDFNVKYKSSGENEIDQLGEHINQMSETLEQTISELKSANNKLQTDIQKKTEIDEMRKEFLSNVSHELKTPIALIQGYAEGLKESVNDDAESRDFYCDVIIDESAKMNKMVQKLLTLNQIEFGNNYVEMERFDIIALIDEVLNQSNILLQEKNAEVFFDNQTQLYVWADEFQIEEVLTNYISNAIHHLGFAKKIWIFLEEKGLNSTRWIRREPGSMAEVASVCPL